MVEGPVSREVAVVGRTVRYVLSREVVRIPALVNALVEDGEFITILLKDGCVLRGQLAAADVSFHGKLGNVVLVDAELEVRSGKRKDGSRQERQELPWALVRGNHIGYIAIGDREV